MRVRCIKPTIEPSIQKKRVCAYARVSTNNKEQEDSLENQTKYYEDFIFRNPEFEYVGIFADKGITGTTSNRPEFQRMLKLCREKKIDIIVTKSVSRFARDTVILLSLVRELKNIGVEVRFEKENLNTLSMGGELVLAAVGALATEEVRSMSENQKWRVQRKFERGELIINTNRFLGYDKDEFGMLKINVEESKIVEYIYEEYLKGKGSYKIAKELNRRAVPTVTGALWDDDTILNILKNEKYKGDAILQKYYTPEGVKRTSRINKKAKDRFFVDDNHSGIVTREAWEEVQNEIKRRRRAKGINENDVLKYQNRYRESGMLYCGKCGSKLKRRVWNSNKKYKKVVWQCSNYINNGKEVCTGTVIEDIVVSKLNIKEEIIVYEEVRNGKNCYTYASKSNSEYQYRGQSNYKEANGCIL